MPYSTHPNPPAADFFMPVKLHGKSLLNPVKKKNLKMASYLGCFLSLPQGKFIVYQWFLHFLTNFWVGIINVWYSI